MQLPQEVFLIIYLFLSAFVTACISYFLEMCFMEGNIFQGYLPWLAKCLLDKESNEECNRLEDSPARRRLIIKHAEEKSFWFKPLGGCPACTNIWLGAAIFWMFRWYFDLPYIYIVPYLMIGNFFLRKMNA